MMDEHLRAELHRYVYDGVPPGHFLTAVAQNNLFKAIARADENTITILSDLVKLFYCQLPSQCHGSEEKVQAWIEMPVEERKRITQYIGYQPY